MSGLARSNDFVDNECRASSSRLRSFLSVPIAVNRTCTYLTVVNTCLMLWYSYVVAKRKKSEKTAAIIIGLNIGKSHYLL